MEMRFFKIVVLCGAMAFALDSTASADESAPEFPTPGCDQLLSQLDSRSAANIAHLIDRLTTLEEGKRSEDENEIARLRKAFDTLVVTDAQAIRTLEALRPEFSARNIAFDRALSDLLVRSLEESVWSRLSIHAKFQLLYRFAQSSALHNLPDNTRVGHLFHRIAYGNPRVSYLRSDLRQFITQGPPSQVSAVELKEMARFYLINGAPKQRAFIIEKFFGELTLPEFRELLPVAIVHADKDNRVTLVKTAFQGASVFQLLPELQMLIDLGDQDVLRALAESWVSLPEVADHVDVLHALIEPADSLALAEIASQLYRNKRIAELQWTLRWMASRTLPGSGAQHTLAAAILSSDLTGLNDVLGRFYDQGNPGIQSTIAFRAIGFKRFDTARLWIKRFIQECPESEFKRLPEAFDRLTDLAPVRDLIELWIHRADPEHTFDFAEDLLRNDFTSVDKLARAREIADLLDPFLMKASPEALTVLDGSLLSDAQKRLVQIRLHELVFSGDPTILIKVAKTFKNTAIQEMKDLRRLLVTLGDTETLKIMAELGFTGQLGPEDKKDLRTLIERADFGSNATVGFAILRAVHASDAEIKVLMDSLQLSDTAARRKFIEEELGKLK